MGEVGRAFQIGGLLTGLSAAPFVVAQERPAGLPAPPAHKVETPRDGQSDFDFLIGSWRIHNRRLKNPLTGSTSWYEFEGAAVARMIWGGRANIDEYEADTPSGHIQGLTLRLYDPKAKQWSLYWANSAKGTLEKPTIGEFRDGRGEFFDHEPFEGRMIFVRYVWSEITPQSCRWEQAFSADGGKTWETNWIMEMTRPSP
jgi:hypothetical protein